jgi:hypothetical protein
MSQANSENSTAMPVVQSRRRFLSQAAGVAAGGAVLALAAIPPARAAAAPASALANDGRLLEMVNRIFELRDVIDESDPEIVRLQNIWTEEMLRLYEASLTGECTLSKEERSAAVAAMPECIEHKRLVELQRPHCLAQDELIKQVLATPALTPEGKQEKFFVLLNFVMPDGWRENDKRADYDIEQARKFMIELIGGEEAEQLREGFA